MVVPVVDVGAAAAALQQQHLHQDIVPVPPALLEPINNQVWREEDSALGIEGDLVNVMGLRFTG